MKFDRSKFRFNSPLGKRLLAAARDGDYAHPGEEEAIRLALSGFSANPRGNWLDAGCGRGGTAAYVQSSGWADVTAFDIDAVSIREARAAYPAITFHECGVLEAPAAIRQRFSLVYSFNAFYAFPDQPASLCALRALAENGARLVLSDYVDRGGFVDSSFARGAEAAHWLPIDPRKFPGQLAAAKWRLDAIRDLDAEYARWYADLVNRFADRRAELTVIAPAEATDYATEVYAGMLAAVRAGTLGGAIFTATAT